ncbi:hypothetical protein U1Q18_039781 [Sarracenia purpurea var. burkii]
MHWKHLGNWLQQKPLPALALAAGHHCFLRSNDHYLRRLEPTSSGEQDLYAAGCDGDLYSAVDSTPGVH